MKSLVLVTGQTGQLAQELQQVAYTDTLFNWLFVNRSQGDICNFAQIEQLLVKHQPAYVINTAAYTAVDRAETDRSTAMMTNAEAVSFLAECCKKNNCKFIGFSTDYVFDGNGTSPYPVHYPKNPVNYYGLTKQLGEEAAFAHNNETLIIRTSWVYSSYGNNFVKTMLRLMQEKPALNVVNDQFGSPTYAADLAKAVYRIIQLHITQHIWKPGIYHYSNTGIISWHQFAEAIQTIAAPALPIHGIPTKDYPTPAKRPAYSALDCSSITEAFGIELISWHQSLINCLQVLNKRR
jgi:dTDP-4-dehydrorhamnose reductase